MTDRSLSLSSIAGLVIPTQKVEEQSWQALMNMRVANARRGILVTNEDEWGLYVGMTSDLHRRVFEHRVKRYPKSFTSQYNCVMLVYFRGFDRIEEAITEEKRLKAGSRDQKEQAIGNVNAGWNDLWEDVKNW